MYQTLLAVGALLAFAYFAVGRQQVDNDVERRAIMAAADLAAADLAEDRMAEILNDDDLAWDERHTENAPVRNEPGSSPLGPDTNANGDETSGSPYDDLDDVHGMVHTREVAAGAGALQFSVRDSVFYLVETDLAARSSAPTRVKQVQVSVSELGARGRRPATATLKRVVTPMGHHAHGR